MLTQDKIFTNYEGDNWFKRNNQYLKTDNNLFIFLMRLYGLKPKRVLEIGASNGYMAAEIHKQFGSKVYAVEPASKAAKDGKKRWPFINFQKATASTMRYKKHFFDLIRVNGVLHWMDRTTLLNSIANIDKVLDWGGCVMIGDFLTHAFIKRRYHHLKNERVFTYKADYRKMFLSTGLYKEIAYLSKNHDQDKLALDTDIDNYFGVSLLRKEDMYIER